MKAYGFAAGCALLLLASCTNELDTSIANDLSIETRANIAKEDSLTFNRIQYLDEVSKWFEENPAQESKYKKITYNRWCKYLEKYTEVSSVDDKDEFISKHPEYLDACSKADEIVKQYEIMCPDSLFRITFVGKHNVNTWLMSNLPVFDFEITPLKDGIDQLDFYYQFQNKMTSDGGFIHSDKFGTVYINKPIRSKQIIHEQTSINDTNSYWSTLQDLTFEDISTNYNLYFYVSDFQYKGLVYSKVPYGVKYYRESIGTEVEKYAYDYLIKEIDPNILTFLDYHNQEAEKKMAKFDSLVLAFDKDYNEWKWRSLGLDDK